MIVVIVVMVVAAVCVGSGTRSVHVLIARSGLLRIGRHDGAVAFTGLTLLAKNIDGSRMRKNKHFSYHSIAWRFVPFSILHSDTQRSSWRVEVVGCCDVVVVVACRLKRTRTLTNEMYSESPFRRQPSRRSSSTTTHHHTFSISYRQHKHTLTSKPSTTTVLPSSHLVPLLPHHAIAKSQTDPFQDIPGCVTITITTVTNVVVMPYMANVFE